MFVFLIVVALLLLTTLYVARAAWSPYGGRGRRRLLHWARGWWRGDQAENRDEY
ncbi:hypothetical protein Psed_0857 [Pseudonocardia dioxanivorans CB1190]|uniref:Uncharacterized protein n=1 Tax=Pseudonocardia dioxanivorans (strain ATCC 55486 / DSM 44775 / JCM 13855 / CB1190) TaxID=675635 RepID=F4CSD7_PSEUX|nr:hypothetical protein [Pseudonocardia dioxanivorans]AEA23111.1 hypothetical protein Psed_0857 [Pseudonocardia dioxanivorans CB1190]